MASAGNDAPREVGCGDGVALSPPGGLGKGSCSLPIIFFSNFF